MELLRIFTRIRKIELEIQTINENTLDVDHPSMSFYNKNSDFFLLQLY